MRDLGKAVSRTLNLAAVARTCFDAAIVCGVFGALSLTTSGERLVGALVIVFAASVGIVGLVLHTAAGRLL